MRFTHIDVNFDVRYEGHQNCPKILSMNILRVFSDHHLWRQNWCQYVWTSLCQFNFLVNLLHSLGVWFFDIWHLFDNLTYFWHFGCKLPMGPIAYVPNCPYPCTPLSMYPIAHVTHTPCTPYNLCPYCPCAPYPCTPYPSGPHCPYAPYPLYPISPCVPIAYVPHTPCTPLPLWASLAMCPTPPVPHFPLCPHCPCGPYPMCAHCPCATWPMWAIPPVPHTPCTLFPHVPYCPCGPSPLSPIG